MTELEKLLIAKKYRYTKNENNQITITKNDKVELNGLTTLEPSTVFNNSGRVELNGLTDFDAINLGYEKRNIKITKHKTKGLCVSLGCFYGNETESIIAIRLKYGYGSKYEIELINAFKKHK